MTNSTASSAPTRPIKDYPINVRKKAREILRARLDKKHPPKNGHPNALTFSADEKSGMFQAIQQEHEARRDTEPDEPARQVALEEVSYVLDDSAT